MWQFAKQNFDCFPKERLCGNITNYEQTSDKQAGIFTMSPITVWY